MYACFAFLLVLARLLTKPLGGLCLKLDKTWTRQWLFFQALSTKKKKVLEKSTPSHNSMFRKWGP